MPLEPFPLQSRRTGVTLPVFNYLAPISESKKYLVDEKGIEPSTSALRTPRSPN
jgi:hypothetical protein